MIDASGWDSGGEAVAISAHVLRQEQNLAGCIAGFQWTRQAVAFQETGRKFCVFSSHDNWQVGMELRFKGCAVVKIGQNPISVHFHRPFCVSNLEAEECGEDREDHDSNIHNYGEREYP